MAESPEKYDLDEEEQRYYDLWGMTDREQHIFGWVVIAIVIACGVAIVIITR
jgi:hypothetical protein